MLQLELDEMRNDMLLEDELRRDVDKAIAHVDNHHRLHIDEYLGNLINSYDILSEKLRLYGYEISAKDLLISKLNEIL